jgi:hypothetical protein
MRPRTAPLRGASALKDDVKRGPLDVVDIHVCGLWDIFLVSRCDRDRSRVQSQQYNNTQVWGITLKFRNVLTNNCCVNRMLCAAV